jgi:putative acetyltransferase
MYDAVRHGRSDYSEEQRQAWVPDPRSDVDWHNRLLKQQVLVAVNATTIAGFMSLADNGYIDLAYIRPTNQSTGIFRRLFNEVEELAMRLKAKRLWVHASLMAQPAFTAMGFSIVREEVVELGGQSFQRYEMEKTLC